MKLKSQKGTSMVEFAIIAPLLFIVLFGIAEFGLALYDKAMITNASREGARAGIVYRVGSGGSYNPLNTTEIKNVVTGYLGTYLVSFKPSTVTVSIPVTCAGSGATLSVTVSYPYNFLVLPNFVSGLVGPIQLTAQAVMRCE